MALTDTVVRTAKTREKAYKLWDERGLFLLVSPSGSKGSKLWRLKYRHDGKEKLIALGAYPDVTLAKARERRDDERRRVANGVDPSIHRKIEKAGRRAAQANSFEAVAIEWISKYSPKWSESHADKIKRRLQRDVFPWIGTRSVSSIEPQELLAVLRRVEARGRIETAHRALQNCGQVFRYAVAIGAAKSDPSRDLRGALQPAQETHHASITDAKAAGQLLRDLEGYQGSFVTACALRLAPLLFVRPGELRKAEWSEINLDGAEWRIPAAKMKARAPHIVPLSVQAVEILRELHPVTGARNYVFPGLRTHTRPMSENTVNAALRRLGYTHDQMTGHGFRSMASTMLNEQGWNRDAIERQLAHAERDSVRAAYNYAEHLPERRKMMQTWADYLDRLRTGEGKVIAGNFGRAAA